MDIVFTKTCDAVVSITNEAIEMNAALRDWKWPSLTPLNSSQTKGTPFSLPWA